MASSRGVIKDAIEANAPIVAILTGGIHDWTGGRGLSLAATPSAFDSNGLMKPSAVVRAVNTTPDNAVRDDGVQLQSAVERVQVYVYDNVGYTNVESAMDLITALLHARKVSSTVYCFLQNKLDEMVDEWMDDVAVGRLDFAIYRMV